MMRTGQFSPRWSALGIAAAVLVAAPACGSDEAVPDAAPGRETTTEVTTIVEEHAPPEERPDPQEQPESTECDPGPAMAEAVAGFRPASAAPDRGWVLADRSQDCPTLGYAEITVEGATGSSPTQLLLFHRDQFLGTGVKCDILGTVEGSTDDSVTVGYRWPVGDEPNAMMSGRADVTFQWDGSQVQMRDPLPDAATLGQSC